MAENKNIDSLLMNSQAPVTAVESVEPVERSEPAVERAAPEPVERQDAQDVQESVDYGVDEVEPSESSPEESAVPETDEYGNSIGKQRMYSEEEVQRMIRDRLSRGQAANYQQPPTQQEVKDAQQGFEHDPNSNQSWEEQLEAFIDKKLEKNQQKAQRKAWEETERNIQAEFESRFTTGMQKYKDFQQVAAGKPLTNSIMLATRNMKDPAAFIYAACKTQAKELDRIARIPDPYQQAAEIGRLEERMRRNRAAASNSPRPLERTKGDMVEKGNTRPSLDSLIHQHAKSKVRR